MLIAFIKPQPPTCRMTGATSATYLQGDQASMQPWGTEEMLFPQMEHHSLCYLSDCIPEASILTALCWLLDSLLNNYIINSPNLNEEQNYLLISLKNMV